MTTDPFGALLDEAFDPIPGSDAGPLVGSTFVAKDLFAVTGHVTGAGQPAWAATHDPAPAHATAVQRLLDAGSTLVGRAHTSEMAYSLAGRDNPWGGPDNPAAPGHDPGGSSSGSAAAVAAGLADLALGTDTLGSVRVPASSCGVFGWRPTHGLVPTDGVHPLAASLDVVGLLAGDPALLARAAGALVDRPLHDGPVERVVMATDAFDLLAPLARAALLDAATPFGPTATVDLAPPWTDLGALTELVRDVQGPEFAAAHRSWIEAEQPRFGPGVAERIAHALAVTPGRHAEAVAARDRLRSDLSTVLVPGTVVLLPAAGPPPARHDADGAFAASRRVAAGLSVVGSLAGLPTVTVPAAMVNGLPIGLSLLGAPGTDGTLLSLAARPPTR